MKKIIALLFLAPLLAWSQPTAVSGSNGSSLPTQTGNNGKYLSTDGSAASWSALTSGSVTVVGAGSLTSTALVTGGGTTTLQTPAATATMDSSGNISTPGSVTTGAGGSVAGSIGLGQGTAPSTGTTNVKIYAPTSVTSYTLRVFGSAPTSGLVTATTTSTDTVLTTTAPGTGVLTALTVAANATGGLVTAGGAPRILTITSSATPSINTDSYDCVTITAQAAAITSMTSGRTGTINNFQQLEIRIKDDGTARAITWGTDYASGIATLPTTTTAGKPLVVYLEGDTVQGKFMCMGTGSYP